MDDEQRGGEDRRATNVSHEMIWSKLCELEPVILENRERITNLEERVLPPDWEEVLRDVAAVGRTGRLIKRVVVWGTPILVAIVGVYHYVLGMPPTNPPG